ncbi:MAG: hypothetical protein M3198_13305 [Actinomycetota bacterium]|nr:hypothetical protein [Actinomycetota bacterium]
MQPPVRIKVTKKTDPDLERFAAALLALAIARLEAGKQETGEASPQESEEDRA